MYPNLGDFETGKTLFFPFHTFNAAGASVTLTGLAVTDIEVYKGESMTQRSSDAGYTLVDTDGIDLDGITGIHGFTIDTSDNTDAGFYAAGNDYIVIVSAVTVDSQAVSFIVGRFSISNRAGLKPTVEGRTLDVTAGGNAGIDLDNVSLSNGSPTNAILASGTLSGTHSSTTADLGANAPGVDVSQKLLTVPSRGFARYVDSYVTGTGVATFSPSTAVTLTDGDQWFLFEGAPGSTAVLPAVNMTQLGGDAQSATDLKDFADAGYDPGTNKIQGVVLADAVTLVNGLAANVLTAASTAADYVTELQSGLATAAALDTVDNFLDTEIASIISTLSTIQSTLAALGGYVDTEVAAILAAVDTEVAAIKAKTDSLTFTVAGVVDANIQRINDVAITGDGQPGTEFDI